MNPKKNTIAVTFRCDVAVVEKLDELCQVMGIKRSEFLISAITSQYDSLQGNPEMKKMLEQFKQIADTVKQLTGGSRIVGIDSSIASSDGSEGEA